MIAARRTPPPWLLLLVLIAAVLAGCAPARGEPAPAGSWAQPSPMPAPPVTGPLAQAQQAADDYVDTVVAASWSALWDLLPTALRTDVSRAQVTAYGERCDKAPTTFDVREVTIYDTTAQVRADRDGEPTSFNLTWDTDVWRWSPPSAVVQAWQQNRC